MDYCVHIVDIITRQYIIKYSSYTGMGETGGYQFDFIFIMLGISEVLCGGV